MSLRDTPFPRPLPTWGGVAGGRGGLAALSRASLRRRRGPTFHLGEASPKAPLGNWAREPGVRVLTTQGAGGSVPGNRVLGVRVSDCSGKTE